MQWSCKTRLAHDALSTFASKRARTTRTRLRPIRRGGIRLHVRRRGEQPLVAKCAASLGAGSSNAPTPGAACSCAGRDTTRTTSRCSNWPAAWSHFSRQRVSAGVVESRPHEVAGAGGGRLCCGAVRQATTKALLKERRSTAPGSPTTTVGIQPSRAAPRVCLQPVKAVCSAATAAAARTRTAPRSASRARSCCPAPRMATFRTSGTSRFAPAMAASAYVSRARRRARKCSASAARPTSRITAASTCRSPAQRREVRRQCAQPLRVRQLHQRLVSLRLLLYADLRQLLARLRRQRLGPSAFLRALAAGSRSTASARHSQPHKNRMPAPSREARAGISGDHGGGSYLGVTLAVNSSTFSPAPPFQISNPAKMSVRYMLAFSPSATVVAALMNSSRFLFTKL
jgi:hypothetical protein